MLFLQGISIVEQVDVSSSRRGLSQEAQDASICIEAKLKQIYAFMSDYMMSATIEE